jgi:dTDP-glucose pyrophosphorylase
LIDKDQHIIGANISLKEALKKLNSLGANLTLFVIDEQEKLCGVITDGDIRRGLVNGITIEDPVKDVMNRNFRSVHYKRYTLKSIKEYKQSGIKLLPVLDDDSKVIRLINLDITHTIIPADAVIMAGGRGERLRPLTDNTPKPMLHVGDKPIIEHNIDRIISYGISNIYISLKYLGHKIKDHFKNGEGKGVNINYVTEIEPLGTIGAVSMVKSFGNDTILIMNSDILTNIDLEDFYINFIEQDAAMSIAAIGYTVNVPYAVLEMNDSQVSSLKEKPDYTFHSNTGIYLLKKEYLKYIPENVFFNATDLIEKLISLKHKVVTYPMLGYWLDIGRPEDYIKAQEDVKHITFK